MDIDSNIDKKSKDDISTICGKTLCELYINEKKLPIIASKIINFKFFILLAIFSYVFILFS